MYWLFILQTLLALCLCPVLKCVLSFHLLNYWWWPGPGRQNALSLSLLWTRPQNRSKGVLPFCRWTDWQALLEETKLVKLQESCAIAKMTAQCPHATYTWMPWNFRDALTTPIATIPNIFHGLLFRSKLWMFVQNLKSVPEIIGGTLKFGHSLDTPTLPFLQNF